LDTRESVAWLDRNINHQDIPVAESAVFLHNAVRGIMTKFGIADVSLLALDRYRCAMKSKSKFNSIVWLSAKMPFSGFFFLIPVSCQRRTRANFSTISYDPSFIMMELLFKKHYFRPNPVNCRSLPQWRIN